MAFRLLPTLVLVASCAPKAPPAPAAEPPRAVGVTTTEPRPGPVNLSFEDGWDGWFVGGPVDGDADAFVVADGTRSARLRAAAGQWGTWTQCASAGAWLGGQVTLTARMRTADVGGKGAGLWLRIDDGIGQDRTVLAFDNSAGRMLTGDTGWTSMQITLPVAAEADAACFGMLLSGDGTAWIDDLRFELAPLPAATEGPLDDRGAENLQVLAQIWGAARYFVPPIDEVEIDWDRLLVDAIPVVEAARSDDALAAALEKVFEPAYGAVRIVPEAPAAPPPPSTREIEPGVLYVVPGGAVVDPGDARAVLVDLRGGVSLPDALAAAMAHDPAEIPRVRWTLHEGYYAIDPSRREEGYDVVLPEERTGRIVPSGGPPWPATILLVDATTAPRSSGRSPPCSAAS